ncbi:MAG: hypothetical protein J0H46_01235 [Bacteroidetes bacterium]|nr:hypothetical protein [Bacteroidota bacterium]
MNKFTRLLKTLSYHPNLKFRTLITITVTIIGLYINYFRLQVFCRPVFWASLYMGIFFTALIFFPFVKNTFLKKGLYFILGAGTLCCIYCIIFLADPWEHFTGYIFFILLILFFGAGLLAFLPVYYLWHVLNYMRQGNTADKRIFIYGILTPLLPLFIYLSNFSMHYKLINLAIKSNNIAIIPADRISERILGIGFKYHTKINYLYDGWRPPIHDPLLNIGLWIFSKSYYPYHAIPYYKQVFPELPLQANCVCAYTKDGLSYLTDTAYFNQAYNPGIKSRK